jgi:inosine/xanthosine triphosphatase
MLIAVGSDNPTKIDPVKNVFSTLFGEVEVIGKKVSSGVPEQPRSEDEMFTGAKNRATEALKLTPEAEYGVGIEGGLDKKSFGWYESSIVVIVNRAGEMGIGASGGLVLPEAFMKEIHKGLSLEDAVDLKLGTHKIGRGIGMFGIMTNKYVTRAQGVEHGVAFALGRFLHKDLYDIEL